MVVPVFLAAPAAVHIDDDGVLAKFQLGDLHVVAGIYGRAVRGHRAIQQLRLNGLPDVDEKTFFAGGQRLGGFGEFSGDVADQVEFRLILQSSVLGWLGWRRLRLGGSSVAEDRSGKTEMSSPAGNAGLELPGEWRRSTPGTSAASRKTVSVGMSQFDMDTVASRPGDWSPLFYDAYRSAEQIPDCFRDRDGPRPHWGTAYETLTWTPDRSIFMGRSWPPASATADSTRSRASGSIRQHDAATATRTADLSRQSALAAGAFDDAVDRFRGDGRKIALSEAPLFAHQSAGFGPVGFLQSAAKLLRDLRDAREIVVDLRVSVDVFLEDVPIVDGGLARLAGVAKYEAALEFGEIDAQLGAMLAAGRKLDGGGATEGRRIMVLRARGNADHDGFGVAADVDPVGLALPCSREAVERGANGHGHGAGAADSRARGSFGVGRQGEAAVRAGRI